MRIIDLASDTQRFAGWKTAIVALGEHPWRWAFGWGPETFTLVYRLHRTPEMFAAYPGTADHAHNIVLELLVTVGLVGFTAVGCLLWALWDAADNVGRATLLGVLLMSMLEPVPFQAWGLMLFIVGARTQVSRPGGSLMRFLALPCLVTAAALWMSNYCAYASAQALAAGDRVGAHHRAYEAAILAPSSIVAMKAQLLAGRTNDPMSLEDMGLFHPHDSDAAQLGVMAALMRNDPVRAIFYAHRACRFDPANSVIAAQTAALERAFK